VSVSVEDGADRRATSEALRTVPPTTFHRSQSALLEIDGVAYRYPTGTEALARIDASVAPGEIVSVVGPSGCGKSTLLGLIAGLLAPSGGRILWDNAILEDKRDLARRHLAMVFQRDTVFPWRSVEKNVQFGMESLSLSRTDKRAWTESLLRMARLEDFRDSYPRALSGGMRRRLALLMALAVRPAVLLLDEPFAALDEPTRVGLTEDVLRLAYEYNVSVVLVTHDIAEAISLADRVLVLSDRPSTVIHDVPVPFGHDRDVIELRQTPEYQGLYAEIWEQVWATIRTRDLSTSTASAPAR
jgi:NitT/TauT family transport system ATP-binding protein